VAAEIVESLEAALEHFRGVAAALAAEPGSHVTGFPVISPNTGHGQM